MTDFLLTQVINYGAPFFWVMLFLGALGLPVGASILLIAAGTFSQQEILNCLPASLLGLLGAVCGDALSFGMGHCAKILGGQTIWWITHMEKRTGCIRFTRRDNCLTHPIPHHRFSHSPNLIAGGEGMRFRRFMTYDILGEITWIILYGGLGYWFGSQWELVSTFISNFGGLLLGVVILGVGIWLGIKRLKTSEPEKSLRHKTQGLFDHFSLAGYSVISLRVPWHPSRRPRRSAQCR